MANLGGKKHFFGDHPQPLNRTNDFKGFIAKYTQLANDLKAAGIEVINCSMHSALTQFTKRRLEDVMCELSSR